MRGINYMSDKLNGCITLHITSGECSAYALRQLLPKADIVAFNEAMCEGACCGVVGSVDFKQLRSLAYNVNMDEYLAKSPWEHLQQVHTYNELALYFDYDMFCVVNAITLLAFFEQQRYAGKITFNLIAADGGANVVKSWPVILGCFNECYQRVLVEHKEFVLSNQYFDKGVELYLDYVQPENKITSFIRAHGEVEHDELVVLLLKQFADYGLTDFAAERFIKAVKSKA